MTETEFTMETTKEQIIGTLKEYKAEIILLSICATITTISLYLFLETLTQSPIVARTPYPKEYTDNSHRIIIDISGGVKNPKIYETKSGARIADIVIMAGGFSAEADKQYIARNINLARLVIDQDKIHIPTLSETSHNIISEEPQYIDYSSPRTQNQVYGKAVQKKIDINSADKDSLLTVEGITEKIADTIIEKRPFYSVRDLYTNKIVNKTVYDKVSASLTVTQ